MFNAILFLLWICFGLEFDPTVPASADPPAAADNATFRFRRADLAMKAEANNPSAAPAGWAAAADQWAGFVRDFPAVSLVPYARLNQAVCLYQAGKYEDAARAARLAADAPNFRPRPKALLALGKAHREVGRAAPGGPALAAAADALRAAEAEVIGHRLAAAAAAGGATLGATPVRDRDTAAEAAYALAEVFQLQGRAADVAAAADRIGATYPDHRLAADARFLHASGCFARGDYPAAAAAFARLLADYPGVRTADARLYRGLALARAAGPADDAAADLTAAVTAGHHRRAAALYEIGGLHEKSNRPADAADAYRRAVSAADWTNSPAVAIEALHRLAVLAAADRPADAVKLLTQAIARNPAAAQDAAVRYRLAHLLFAQKQYADAAAAGRELVARHPSAPLAADAAMLAAAAFEEAKQLPDAAKMAEIAAAGPKHRAAAKLVVGRAALADRRHADAAAAFAAVVAADPKPEQEAAAHIGRGTALAALGRTDAARAAFAQALAAVDEAVAGEAVYRLAELDLAAGRTAAAADGFLAAAARSKAWAPSGLLRAGRALEAVGEQNKAVGVYRTLAADHPDSPQAGEARKRAAELAK